MRRNRLFPPALALLLGLVLFGVAASSVRAAEGDADGDRPPNVVLFFADDLGAGELGSYGHPEHRTPRLDRLAREGMRLRTCWSTPLCTPSRVLLLTGRYGFRTGYFNFLLRNWAPRRDSPEFAVGDKTTFADLLRPAGYRTGVAGKWQLPGDLPGLVRDCGFDTYCIWTWLHPLPEGVRHTGEFERPGKPSRFWHPGILRDGEYVPTEPGDYGPDIYTDFLIRFMEENRDRPFVAYYPMALTHTPWDPTPDPGSPGERRPRGLRSNVEYLDHCVGRVVDAVDRLGLAERTLVIFTGDNGTQGAGKGNVTEMGVRVPLICRMPGTVREGVVSDALTDLADILPTLLDLAGVEAPEGHALDGKSLLPVLRGEREEHRPWIFSYLGRRRMLRTERWLLEGDGHLYDCGDRRDPREGYRDVTGSDDPEVRAARRRFDRLLEDLPGPGDREGLVRPKRKAEGR